MNFSLKNKKSVIFSIAFIFFLLPENLFAQNYPEIQNLSSKDILFKQYSQEVEMANKASLRGNYYPQNFYSYTCKESDSCISVSARCCIRQETLATVNSIEDAQASLHGKKIILPVKDGLFISEEPVSTLEMILLNENLKNLSDIEKLKADSREFYFLPDGKFSPSQRAFFLNPGFVPPLEKKVITSAFGKRISPISGKWRNHNGIDLASPFGSKVFACRSGKVLRIMKNHEVYGNCIILLHSSGFTSLYAHLDQILVEKDQIVAPGHLIGKVGLTGLTTGPHLHFEIHQNGIAENPEKYM